MAQSLRSSPMSNRTMESTAWASLKSHMKAMQNVHMRDLFAKDTQRFNKLHLSIEGLTFDFSRHRIDDSTIKMLTALAKVADIEGWRSKMFAGEKINTS